MFILYILGRIVVPILLFFAPAVDRTLAAVSAKFGLLWFYSWARGWIARRFGRKHVSHKRSLSSLPVIPTKRNYSLESATRLGGVSLLRLPPRFAAAEYAIPTSVAATAGYLIDHGPTTPGIFRVPGQSKAVTALHQHYAAQIEAGGKSATQVELTIRNATLPQDLTFTTHDIASVFKKVLADLPGGILGSVELLLALKKSIDFHASDDCRPAGSIIGVADTEQIAQTLLELESCHRLSLISTVFGLLAYLKQDVDEMSVGSTERNQYHRSEVMSSKAFGVIFAPLLLSDLTDQIELEHLSSQESSLPMSISSSSLVDPKFSTSKVTHVAELSKGVARASLTAAIAEVLISNWDRIVICIRQQPNSTSRYLRWASSPTPTSSPRQLRRKDSIAELLASSGDMSSRVTKKRSTLARSASTTLAECKSPTKPTSIGRTASVHFLLQNFTLGENFTLDRDFITSSAPRSSLTDAAPESRVKTSSQGRRAILSQDVAAPKINNNPNQLPETESGPNLAASMISRSDKAAHPGQALSFRDEAHINSSQTLNERKAQYTAPISAKIDEGRTEATRTADALGSLQKFHLPTGGCLTPVSEARISRHEWLENSDHGQGHSEADSSPQANANDWVRDVAAVSELPVQPFTGLSHSKDGRLLGLEILGGQIVPPIAKTVLDNASSNEIVLAPAPEISSAKGAFHVPQSPRNVKLAAAESVSGFGGNHKRRGSSISSISSVSKIPRPIGFSSSSQETISSVDLPHPRENSRLDAASRHWEGVSHPLSHRPGTPWQGFRAPSTADLMTPPVLPPKTTTNLQQKVKTTVKHLSAQGPTNSSKSSDKRPRPRTTVPMASRLSRTPLSQSPASSVVEQQRGRVLRVSSSSHLNRQATPVAQISPPPAYTPTAGNNRNLHTSFTSSDQEQTSSKENLINTVAVGFRPETVNVHPDLINDLENAPAKKVESLPLDKSKLPTKIAALYAELHRSQRELARCKERAKRAEREIESMRRSHGSAILNEKLREADMQIKHWRERAERAEASILRRDDEQASVIENYVERKIESRRRRSQAPS